METKTPVKTYTLDYLCDVCGKELMRPTNRTVLGYPPKFNHTCGACGYSKDFLVRYPCQVFEEMPQLIEEQQPSRPLDVSTAKEVMDAWTAPATATDVRAAQDQLNSPPPSYKMAQEVVANVIHSAQEELDAALNAAMPTKPVPKKTFPKKKAKR